MSRGPSEPIEIGVVARAHGVSGELRVHLHNPSSDALRSTDTVFLAGEAFELATVRPTNAAMLIRVAGIDDRDAAERRKGQAVAVLRECLDLDEGDVLLVDLVGMKAVLADGTEWGEVIAVEPGAQDRMVVSHQGKRRELPIVDAFVLSVDLASKTIVVSPPEDLPEF